MNLGASKRANFVGDETFEAVVTIDLEHRKLVAEISGVRFEHQLPLSLESVPYVGIYAKQTSSDFSVIERVK